MLEYFFDYICSDSSDISDYYFKAVESIFSYYFHHRKRAKVEVHVIEMIDQLGHFSSCEVDRRRAVYFAFNTFILTNDMRMFKRTEILSSDSYNPIRVELAHHLKSKFCFMTNSQRDLFIPIIKQYITKDLNYRVNLLSSALVLTERNLFKSYSMIPIALAAISKLLTSDYYDVEIKVEVLQFVLENLLNSTLDELYAIMANCLNSLAGGDNITFFLDFVVLNFDKITIINDIFSHRQLTKILFVRAAEVICGQKRQEEIKILFENVDKFMSLDKEWLNSILFAKMFKQLPFLATTIAAKSSIMLMHADATLNDSLVTNFMDNFPELAVITNATDWRSQLQLAEAVMCSTGIFKQHSWVMTLFDYGVSLLNKPNYQLQTKGVMILGKCFRWIQNDYDQSEKLPFVTREILRHKSFFKRRLAVPFLQVINNQLSYSWVRHNGTLDKIFDLMIDIDYISKHVLMILASYAPFLAEEPITELKAKFEVNLDKLSEIKGKSSELSSELIRMRKEIEKYEKQPNLFKAAVEEESNRIEEEAKFFVYEKVRSRTKSFSTTNTKKHNIKVLL